MTFCNPSFLERSRRLVLETFSDASSLLPHLFFHCKLLSLHTDVLPHLLERSAQKSTSLRDRFVSASSPHLANRPPSSATSSDGYWDCDEYPPSYIEDRRGRAYLSFMGNEFGHPKRVEFPMPSNNYSFTFANRRWDLLVENEIHKNLFKFDMDMTRMDENEQILSRGPPKVHHVNDSNMVILYIRGPFLFIVNFHPYISHKMYSIGIEEAGEYKVILNTDEISYGGRGDLKDDQYLQKTSNKRADGYRNSLEVTLPRRSAQVYKLTDFKGVNAMIPQAVGPMSSLDGIFQINQRYPMVVVVSEMI